MISKEVFNRMNKVIKTSNIVKELARMEMTDNKTFTGKEIREISKNCDIDIITHKDIDFQKSLANNKEYQLLLNSIDVYGNRIKAGICTTQIKEELLELIEKKDNVYNAVKKEFFK